MVHLQGAIYPQVMDVQPNFSITITLSGSGNTARTGKSLMTTMWQRAMLGYKPERILKLTEAALYDLLSEGTTIYRKFHCHKPTQPHPQPHETLCCCCAAGRVTIGD